MPTLDGPFDLLFIDAEKDRYLNYLRLAEVKMRKGGVVIAGNVGIFRFFLREYLEHARNSGRYESGYVPVGRDGLEVSTKQM